MSATSLDERYLTWLHSQVASVKDRVRRRTHWSLIRQLSRTIFVSVVPHDENRVADAQDLRYLYLSQHEEERGDLEWLRSPCSMLELLMILSDALAFEMDEDRGLWFWNLIETLRLKDYNDEVYDEEAETVVEETLDRVIWRTYEPDGSGGLFPLRHPRQDMRKVELWYQLNAYLLENF